MSLAVFFDEESQIRHRSKGYRCQGYSACLCAFASWRWLFKEPPRRRQGAKKRKEIFEWGRRLFCVFIFLLCTAYWAGAEVLKVGGPGGRFQTIAVALEAAKPGDDIEVNPGAYQGNLVLDKQVSLLGTGKPRIRGLGRNSVIVVNAGGCSIRGFVIEHSGGDLQNEDSGILLRSSGNLVEDNELRDILYGIYLYRAQRNTIRRNSIRGRHDLEIGERGAGLHLWDSPDNLLEGNTISETRDGLYIQSSPGSTIRRNRVSRLRYGVHYMFSDSNEFEDNIFEYNIAGAAIMYSNNIKFRRNAFVHNRGFSSFGILFQECTNCIAEENFIIDNATGIFMEALRSSTFRNNVVAENDVALLIFASAERNLFCSNNFVENLSPLQLIGKRSTTRWDDNGRGNCWSDYRGYDLNGDGIGDVPHKIQNVFEYMEGNFPRLRLYLESPAAQALAMAERAFPVVRGSSEMDKAPLMRAVPLEFRHGEAGSSAAGRTILGTASLLMLATGIGIFRWGRR